MTYLHHLAPPWHRKQAALQRPRGLHNNKTASSAYPHRSSASSTSSRSSNTMRTIFHWERRRTRVRMCCTFLLRKRRQRVGNRAITRDVWSGRYGQSHAQAHRREADRFVQQQAYLNFSDVQYRLVPSSNHASPSGILPFLQPAVTSKDQSGAPDAVPSNKLTKWTKAHSSASIAESKDLRYEAYASMINNALRKAWVCETTSQQTPSR